MTAGERLARWAATRDVRIGAIAAGCWLAGHCALAWALPHANAGSDLGLAIFVFLTATAAEKAERLLSWSFFAWFVAGLVLSVLLGGILWSV